MHRILRYLKSQNGQSMVEYAYILTFVAIVAFIGLQALGVNVKAFLERLLSLM